MRKRIYGILITLLLAGGAVLCAVRWQAWFGMPEEPEWTEDTLSYTFPDLPMVCERLAADSDSVLTILVLGDIHSRLTREDYDTLAARVPQIDLVAQAGDWLERGQSYYYQLLLREWTQSALDSVPVITCPGNHEYSKGMKKNLSPVWEEAFPYGQNGPVQTPGVSYYVDLPSIRFIVIDTNPLNQLEYLTRTLTWLRRAMYSAGDRYVVVMMHHPVLSVGKGRANVLIYSAFRYALGEADLVIAGHDHSYMRRTPFVVLNTAGKLKQQQFRYTPDVTDTVPVYGVIRIENPQISSDKSPMEFRVYRLKDGEILDSLYVTHD